MIKIRVLDSLIEKQITTPELLRLGRVLNIALMSGDSTIFQYVFEIRKKKIGVPL